MLFVSCYSYRVNIRIVRVIRIVRAIRIVCIIRIVLFVSYVLFVSCYSYRGTCYAPLLSDLLALGGPLLSAGRYFRGAATFGWLKYVRKKYQKSPFICNISPIFM